jgi:hypothetical protein
MELGNGIPLPIGDETLDLCHLGNLNGMLAAGLNASCLACGKLAAFQQYRLGCAEHGMGKHTDIRMFPATFTGEQE